MKELGKAHPDRIIAVMSPELVERRWWHFLVRHRLTLLKALLLLKGGPRIALITIPWYVEDTQAGETAGAAAPTGVATGAPVITPTK